MRDREALEVVVGRFLEHKRAHGRKYQSEEAELRLLVRFAAELDVIGLQEITPAMLDDFLASRPRSRPRSFNHLLGVVGCLLDWAVSQQLLDVSPLRARRRRATAAQIPFLFDSVQARRLLDAAGALPDNSRAPQRGVTYRTIFALCYGLGLRAGEACGLRLGDVDTARDLLVVRGGKFGKSRLVPHGPRISELVCEQVERRRGRASLDQNAPLFTFNGTRSVHPGSASQTFHQVVATLDLPVPAGVSPPKAAQPPSQLRGRLPAALVSPGARSGNAAAPALDVHGSRRPVLDRRLFDDHPGAAGRGQPRFEAFAQPTWTETER